MLSLAVMTYNIRAFQTVGHSKQKGLDLQFLIALFNVCSKCHRVPLFGDLMLACIDTRSPAIFGRCMLIKGILLPLFLVKVLSVCPSWHSIVVPEQTPSPQLRHKQINNILE